MSQESIIRALQQLSAGGGKPSLAQLKAKVGPGVPLPQLIQALNRWKADPGDFPAVDDRPDDSVSTDEPWQTELTQLRRLIEAQQRQILALQREVDELKAR